MLLRALPHSHWVPLGNFTKTHENLNLLVTKTQLCPGQQQYLCMHEDRRESIQFLIFLGGEITHPVQDLQHELTSTVVMNITVTLIITGELTAQFSITHHNSAAKIASTLY